MRTKKVMATCAVLLVVAACSDDGTAGPAPLVEKSAIIAAADSICQQHDDAVKKAMDDFKGSHSSPTEPETLDFFTTVVLPIEDRTVGSIKRLGEPTKDRTDYDLAVKSLDEALTAYKEEVADDALGVLKNGTKTFDEAKAKFKAYGFTNCGD